MSGSYEVINGSEESRLMQKWQHLISPITEYGYNLAIMQRDSLDLEAYQKIYENLAPSIVNFRSNINHNGSRFSKLFGMAIDVDKQLVPILFLFKNPTGKGRGFVPASKSLNDVPDFYKRLMQAEKFNDASILNIGETRSYMDLYSKLLIASIPTDLRVKLSKSERLGMIINRITNDTLKSYFLKDQMSEIEVNNLTEFRATFEPFRKYTGPASVKKKYEQVYEQFIGDTAFVGKSAYDFTLPDSVGHMVSMKDFKGKVVFIDVWATWCGPCKEQIPFLKEIEEEYKDSKDIVFVGISLDRLSDRQKWINMVKKENLQGVQLLDDMGKAFGKKYQIGAIPRFLLVSKDGKWIEVRCPRPEDKDSLRRYLDRALEQTPVSRTSASK
jgi:thiol-disulfide isomerase/thioredoxin